MKVLAVLPLYPPKSLVGSWISTHELLRSLVDAGHEVTVIRRLVFRQPEYWHEGVRVLARPNLMTSIPADVVITHVGDDGAGHRHARAAHVPSVKLAHGHPTGRQLEGADLIVFNSKHLRDLTTWTGQSLIIPPPVRAARYGFEAVGEPVDARNTLINLSKEKGGELLNRLAAAEPERDFLGVEGGYGGQMRTTAPNIERMPMTPEPSEIYRRTRVLLMPSLFESYGRVAVEAACSGIPTIAHPSPGLVDTLGDAAIWADRRDLDAWRAALAELDDYDRYIEMSTRALDFADNLTADDDFVKFEAALLDLAGA